ncbi:MAG: lysoplasmalogenase [Flavobacteriales bacterium]|nr:lysoplasmalogenase [Flavobacteriales bacterium]
MKPRSTVLFTIIYAIVGILEMTGEMLRESGQAATLVYIMKPLLMPVLMGWMFANRELLKQKFQIIMLISLVFSTAGDVFLMFLREELFVFGLASFLLAHVLYIIAFYISNGYGMKVLPIGGKLIFALPYVFFVSAFLFILKDHILAKPETQAMFVPVMVYAIVIGTMGVFASWRVSGTNRISFYMVMGGALLFITSDSMIAINKFVQPLPYASLLIMSTYITAQYLIIRGMMLHTPVTR